MRLQFKSLFLAHQPTTSLPPALLANLEENWLTSTNPELRIALPRQLGQTLSTNGSFTISATISLALASSTADSILHSANIPYEYITTRLNNITKSTSHMTNE